MIIKTMAFFGKSKEEKQAEAVSEPVDPGWYRTAKGGFPQLFSLEPEEVGLSGKGGVFLIWHGGVRPEWVYVGHSPDMAQSLFDIGKNKEVTDYENRGGLFVTWAFVLEEYRDGVVKFLQENLPTIVASANTYTDETAAVPVFSPGKEPGPAAVTQSPAPE